MTIPRSLRVVAALSAAQPRPVDEIAGRAGLSVAETQAELALLEADNRVTSSLEGWRLI